MTPVIEANILVHTAMADSYNRNEPHYRPENRAKVRSKLVSLKRPQFRRMLDVGCGTGFIIDLAKDLFDEVHGVDVTQAMLDRVDRTGGNVTLYRCSAERLPFGGECFDFATAYAFLHHLEDYRSVLREVHRVLRPGGHFYVDLEPNRAFWAAIDALERGSSTGREPPDPIVTREIESVLYTDQRVEREFGLSAQVFNNAEYTKARLGGIDAAQFCEDARMLGFRDCRVRYEWFLGQGAVMHGQSIEAAATVEEYLRRALPLSAHLFKYLEFVLAK
jgi:ubiquinone/menaquinone biosynthesis C-methylase UbiE